MTTGVLCPVPILQFFDNTGKPAVGGSVLTQVGGVNAATYSDVNLTTPLPNPIPLNSRGEASTAAGATAQVFLTPNTVYVFTISDAAGNVLDTPQYVNGIQISQSIIGQTLWPQTAGELAVSVTPSNYAYMPGNVLRYGADPTGATDSTTAFSNACASEKVVYVPGVETSTGFYSIANAISLGFADQIVYGDGMSSIVKYKATGNLAATGMFVANAVGSPDHGPWFQKMRLTCDQSGVAIGGSRVNLVQYPPAVYVRGSPRWRVEDCRIDQFTFGIYAQGPTPGGTVTDTEMGCYSCGIAIDGSGDTTRLNNFHFIWFNEWTTNQQAIISDGNTVGISTGRCDGLDIVNAILFTPAKGLNTFEGNGNNQVSDPVTGQSLASNGGTPWLTGFTTAALITNSGFDTYGGIYENGEGTWIQLSNCYFSAASTVPKFIVQTAGDLELNNCRFVISGGPPNPTISLSNNTAAFNFVGFNHCTFQSNFDQTLVSVTGTDPIEVSFNGCEFQTPATTTVNPLVLFTNNYAGGGLTFVNNRFLSKGSGTGTAVSITTAAQEVVCMGNNFNGWSNTFATTGAGATVTKFSASTTGAQIATFSCSNKPGIATTAPTAWLPVVVDGTTYYMPLWT